MWQTKEWLESALSMHDREKMVHRIISVSEELVVAKGENYTSDLVRLVAEAVLGSGDVVKKSYVLKLIPTVPIRRELALSTGLFHREIKVFNTVLKEMEKLMESVDDWREPLWGECLASNIQIGILFQDLRPLGYKIGDRKLGFDIPHAKLVLSSLARFHAMSVVLFENYIFKKDDFSTYVFADVPNPIMQKFTACGLRTFADVITSTWPKQWHDIAVRIKSISGTFLEKMSEVSREENCEFKVLNHGDTWVNNMMFKYDMETRDVCGLRFIDFQISHWNSPAFDIQYFLRTSLKTDLVMLHYEDLLSCYHNSLMNSFKVLRHEPKIHLSLPQLHAEMDRTVCVGFMAASLILPSLLAEKEDVLDFEELFKDGVEGQPRTYMSQAYTKAMMNMLPLFQNKGIF